MVQKCTTGTQNKNIAYKKGNSKSPQDLRNLSTMGSPSLDTNIHSFGWKSNQTRHKSIGTYIPGIAARLHHMMTEKEMFTLLHLNKYTLLNFPNPVSLTMWFRGPFIGALPCQNQK